MESDLVVKSLKQKEYNNNNKTNKEYLPVSKYSYPIKNKSNNFSNGNNINNTNFTLKENYTNDIKCISYNKNDYYNKLESNPELVRMKINESSITSDNNVSYTFNTFNNDINNLYNNDKINYKHLKAYNDFRIKYNNNCFSDQNNKLSSNRLCNESKNNLNSIILLNKENEVNFKNSNAVEYDNITCDINNNKNISKSIDTNKLKEDNCSVNNCKTCYNKDNINYNGNYSCNCTNIQINNKANDILYIDYLIKRYYVFLDNIKNFDPAFKCILNKDSCNNINLILNTCKYKNTDVNFSNVLVKIEEILKHFKLGNVKLINDINLTKKNEILNKLNEINNILFNKNLNSCSKCENHNINEFKNSKLKTQDLIKITEKRKGLNTKLNIENNNIKELELNNKKIYKDSELQIINKKEDFELIDDITDTFKLPFANLDYFNTENNLNEFEINNLNFKTNNKAENINNKFSYNDVVNKEHTVQEKDNYEEFINKFKYCNKDKNMCLNNETDFNIESKLVKEKNNNELIENIKNNDSFKSFSNGKKYKKPLSSTNLLIDYFLNTNKANCINKEKNEFIKKNINDISDNKNYINNKKTFSCINLNYISNSDEYKIKNNNKTNVISSQYNDNITCKNEFNSYATENYQDYLDSNEKLISNAFMTTNDSKKPLWSDNLENRPLKLNMLYSKNKNNKNINTLDNENKLVSCNITNNSNFYINNTRKTMSSLSNNKVLRGEVNLNINTEKIKENNLSKSSLEKNKITKIENVDKIYNINFKDCKKNSYDIVDKLSNTIENYKSEENLKNNIVESNSQSKAEDLYNLELKKNELYYSNKYYKQNLVLLNSNNNLKKNSNNIIKENKQVEINDKIKNSSSSELDDYKKSYFNESIKSELNKFSYLESINLSNRNTDKNYCVNTNINKDKVTLVPKTKNNILDKLYNNKLLSSNCSTHKGNNKRSKKLKDLANDYKTIKLNSKLINNKSEFNQIKKTNKNKKVAENMPSTNNKDMKDSYSKLSNFKLSNLKFDKAISINNKDIEMLNNFSIDNSINTDNKNNNSSCIDIVNYASKKNDYSCNKNTTNNSMLEKKYIDNKSLNSKKNNNKLISSIDKSNNKIERNKVLLTDADNDSICFKICTNENKFKLNKNKNCDNLFKTLEIKLNAQSNSFDIQTEKEETVTEKKIYNNSLTDITIFDNRSKQSLKDKTVKITEEDFSNDINNKSIVNQKSICSKTNNVELSLNNLFSFSIINNVLLDIYDNNISANNANYKVFKSNIYISYLEKSNYKITKESNFGYLKNIKTNKFEVTNIKKDCIDDYFDKKQDTSEIKYDITDKSILKSKLRNYNIEDNINNTIDSKLSKINFNIDCLNDSYEKSNENNKTFSSKSNRIYPNKDILKIENNLSK